MGNLSRLGQVLLLGLCDGEARIAEATRAAIVGDASMAQAAGDARMDRVTFMRHVKRVRATLARLIERGGVEAAELVEA